VRTASPLRYPGGKWRIAPFVSRLLQINDLVGREYVEPYAGGSSLAISLLLQGLVSKIHLNDIDPAIYSFWWSVLNMPDSMAELIADTPLTIDEWRRQKSIYSSGLQAGRLPLGFATLYLNRTNHSGIMNGGPIGGTRQTGIWKMDARFNRNELRRRIEKIASHRKFIRIYRKDALAFLTDHPFSHDAVVYMDPPYFGQGKALYYNAYDLSDHVSVKTFADQFKCPWLISYDDVGEIRRLYRGHRSRRISLLHSARTVHIGSEIMFFNGSLRIPRISIPHARKAAQKTSLEGD